MLSDSLFVSGAVHERTVTLPDGSQHQMWFRELPATAFRAFQLAEQSDDPERRAGSVAPLIAASLCEPDGKPAISVAKALTLKAGPTNAIMSALLEVNGYGGEAKKD